MSTPGVQRVQDKNVDGIMQNIRKYMSLREQQACRINPALVGMITDIVWMQMENLQKVLRGFKSYGPEKFRVADVMAGWDDVRKREFFQPAGQNSILHEISPQDDVNKKHSVAEEAIHDLKTLFKALNPAVESVVGLIESWIMWDLQDASDCFNFEEQLKKVELIRTHEIPPEIVRQYASEMKKMDGEDPTLAEIYMYEINRLRHVLNRFMTRRVENKPFQMLIGRQEEEPTEAGVAEKEVQGLAQHCRIMDMLRNAPDGTLTDEKLLSYFKSALGTGTVSKAEAVAYEVRQISEGKTRLREAMENDGGGTPYDYKMTQARELMGKVEAEMQKAKAIFAVENKNSADVSGSDSQAVANISGIFKMS